MSGARRRSKSLWDNKEEAIPQTDTIGKIPWQNKDLDSSFHGDSSQKHSNSEANDVFMSDDFSHDPLQSNENIPYRGDNRGPRKDRDRSRSPHRNRDRSRGNDDSRASSHRHGNSRFRDDRNKDSDEPRDYHRGNNNRNKNNAYDDQDHRRSSNQNMKPPCRFFLMGNCNRINCKFSHDVVKSEGYERRSHDNDDNNNNRPQPHDHVTKSNTNLDDKNKSWNVPSWNDMESGSFNEIVGNNQDFTQNINGTEKSPDMNGSNGMFLHMDIQKETENIQNKESEKLLEASRNDIPSETVSLPEKRILENALELLYSLPNPASSGAPVESNVVAVGIVDSEEQGNQKPVESVENKKEENLKNTSSGKVEEGDEKAMRQFKIVLVEFVKEILKPTWKEGKMSREVYKTIVKKVVEKVSSSIQGVQIPRTQEKIDQYLAFSKSKITKLVEAYVGRHLKA